MLILLFIAQRSSRKVGGTAASVTLSDSATQTDAVEEVAPSSVVEVTESPPSYNETALEKRITERLHPSPETIPIGAGGRFSQYEELAHELGTRCRIMEEAMVRKGDSKATSSTLQKSDARAATGDNKRDISGRVIDGALPYVRAALHQLPRPAQEYIRSTAAAGQAVDDRTKVIVLFSSVFVAGAFLGTALVPGPHFNPLALALEDSKNWHMSNALDISLISPGFDFALSEGYAYVGGRTWLQRILFGTAEAVARRVPM